MTARAHSVPNVGGSIVVMSAEDVRRLLTIEACIDAVENAFRLYGENAVPAPAVLATHVADGGFHIKAGVLPFEGSLYYAAKTNANFPANPVRHGLPTIQGVVVLFDAECGKLLAVMDSIEITRLRTAAATAVAAKHLARRASQTLAIVGCGTQAPAQVSALFTVLPISHIMAYDIDLQRAGAFVESLRQEYHGRIDVEIARDLASATLQSDVIVTCTTSRKAFLLPEHIRPGTFIAAVGADNEHKQELDPRLLEGNLVVPDVIQQAAMIGELHHAIEAGLASTQSVTTDLGRIVAGLDTGRTSDEQITIFDSTGMALQDVAAASAVYIQASRTAQPFRVRM